MCSSNCFFFCGCTPIVLSLNVYISLSHKSLSVILDHCIAASREVLYVQLYHSVSVSVYNVLLVLLLSLCNSSWRSFCSLGISSVHYSIEQNSIPLPADTKICSAIPQLKDIPSFSNSLPPQTTWV